MALPSSGPLSINDIRTELGISSGSLRTLSSTAGKSTPDSISEFYGYSSAPPIYLSVSVSESSATFATSDGAALNSFNYSTSQSVSGGGYCSGGTGTTSGTLSSGSSSYTWYSFSAGQPAGGTYNNGCGVTCTSTVSASKTGYTNGSNSISITGPTPSASYTCYGTSVSGIRQTSVVEYRSSPDCTNNYPSSISVSGTDGCFAFGPWSLGCSNCMYSGGVTGPSISISCPSVPANGSSTSSATCPTPTFPGLSLSGGSLSPSNGTSSTNYFYVDPGPVVVSYNTNYDNYTRPSGFVSVTCTANGQSHTESEFVSSSAVGIPAGQFQSGTTNSSLSISDWPLFVAGDFGLSSFSGTSVSCTASLPLSTSIYSNDHTISGSGSFTVN